MSYDNRVNANGNNPQRERKPPLLRIADPANAASPNPAIAAAAKIKAEEDLKCQKIKAIKYLAKMGCGCYNKDKKVSDALLAAMKDCTEEVRYAAVCAVMKTSCSDSCPQCGQHSCCNPKMTEQLAKMATEVNEFGCWFEPSARVRAAAAEAADQCCCNCTPIADAPPPEAPPAPPVPPAPPAVGAKEVESGTDAGEQASAANEAEVIAPSAVPVSKLPQLDAAKPAAPVAPVSAVGSNEQAATATSTEPANLGGVEVAAQPEPEEVAPVQTAGTRGMVQYVDTVHQTAFVQLAAQVQLPRGTKLKVYHRYVLGRISSVGEVEVLSSGAGTATVRPIGQNRMSRIATGDEVIVAGTSS